MRKVHKSISSDAHARSDYTRASSVNIHRAATVVQTENVTNLHFIEFLLTALRMNYIETR